MPVQPTVLNAVTGVDVSGANAAVGEVLAPKTFFAVAAPVKTGTMPTVALDPAANAYPAGYHAGAASLTAVDADLVAAKIKLGETIFGVAGSVIPGGTETIEKYWDATLANGATYTPLASGIFLAGVYGPSTQYFSTATAAWYTYNAIVSWAVASAIGDGANFRIQNNVGVDYEFLLFRHYYSTGTYSRVSDESLAAGASWTPATSGFFVVGGEQAVYVQLFRTTGGWGYLNQETLNKPLTITIGDGANWRVTNSGGVAKQYVAISAKLT